MAAPEKSIQICRLKKELSSFDKSPPSGISLYPVNETLNAFEAQIIPGSDTPYKGGIFKIQINIPERYPFEAPSMRFTTPIYHPNIDADGRICLEVFKTDGWVPTMTIELLLLSIQALLAKPNPDDPLMPEIADVYKKDKLAFEQKAEQFTKIHAMQSTVIPSTTTSPVSQEIIEANDKETKPQSRLKRKRKAENLE